MDSKCVYQVSRHSRRAPSGTSVGEGRHKSQYDSVLFTATSRVYAATKGTKGPAYVSPLVGRLDDIGQNGMDVVKNIKLMFSSGDGTFSF